VQLVDVVEDHQTEGEGVEDVEKLVGLEVVVGRQLQRGDELVLQEAGLVEGVVKTQGGSQIEEEGSQVLQSYEGRRLSTG
jgi:hypothetical protein